MTAAPECTQPEIDALRRALEEMLDVFGDILEDCDCNSCGVIKRARAALALTRPECGGGNG